MARTEPLGQQALDYAPKIRRKLTRFAAGIVIVPTVLIVATVSYLTYQALLRHEQRQLTLASTLVQQAFENRKQTTQSRLELFAARHDLAKVVLRPDADKAIAALVAKELPDVGEVHVAGPGGQTLFTAGALPDHLCQVGRAQLGESGSDVAWEEGGLSFHTAIPLETPRGRATALAGFSLDGGFAQDLHKQTGLEVSLVGDGQVYYSTIQGWKGQASAMVPYQVERLRDTFTITFPIYDLLGRQVGGILLSREAADLNRVLLSTLAAIGAIALLAILAALAFALRTTRRVASSLSQLVRGAHRIGGGDLRTRVQLDTQDEFEVLAHAFNHMADEVAQHRDRLLEQERLVQELKLAYEIQQSMLPSGTDENRVEGMVLSGRSLPADSVGGDYFDQLSLGDGRVAIAIGDVNGHGLPAALMMALAKSCLHTQVLSDPSVPAVMATMNRILFSSVKERRFMTFLYGIVDTRRNVLMAATAGHPPAYRIRGTEVVELELPPSYPLGVRYDASYHAVEVGLEAGDVLVFYTDGITEARNAADEEFGTARLESLLVDLAAQDSLAIRDGVLDALRDFMGDRPLDDDVTLLVLKVQYVRREALA